MLSRLMLVTDRAAMQPDFVTALSAALEGGARFIQLRERDLSKDQLLPLASESARLCQRFVATLTINSHLDIARELNASYGNSAGFRVGVHLPQHLIMGNVNSNEYSFDSVLRGASVHSIESAQRAKTAGADYLVFGSIFPTSSHPGETPAGIEKLQAVVKATTLPVYAIGGITDEHTINACLKAGAFGVAMRSTIWAAPDVRGKVAQIMRYFGEEI